VRHGFTILFYLPSPISSFVSLACVPTLDAVREQSRQRNRPVALSAIPWPSPTQPPNEVSKSLP
jgi:hypothetical protein